MPAEPTAPSCGLCAECGFSADVYEHWDWTCVCTLFQEVRPNEGPCVDEQERDWTEREDPDLTGNPKYTDTKKEAL